MMMKNKPVITARNRTPQSGNIFFMLIGAVALIGAMTVAGGNVVRGIVTSMSEVTRKTVAEEKMQSAARLAIQSAVNCDTDAPSDFTEPVAWRDAGTLPHPVGGGLLPETIGATLRDPWGTEYGYCAWNLGNGVCVDSPNRLAGGDNPANTVVAIVSAGKDRRFSSTCGNTGSGGTYTPAAGAVSRWTFDEVAGTQAADSIGANDGTYSGGAVPTTAGVVGTAFQFDGTNYITVPNSPDLNLPQYTVSAWVRGDSAPTTGTREKVVSGHVNYGIFWSHNSNPVTCEHMQDVSYIWAETPSPALTFNAGEWYHLACTYDGSTLRMYVNGALESSVAATAPEILVGEPLTIGISEHTGVYSDGFSGAVDDVLIFNRALSDGEVSDIYSGGGSPGVARDEGSDDIVFEYTYNDAVGLGGDDLWRIIDTRPGTAGINRDIDVAGGADLAGPLNLMRSGLILPGDDATGPCGAATDQQLRINFSMNPAVLEICDHTGGNGWVAISMGGGGGGGGVAGPTDYVAYWTLDETSGSAIADSAGSNTGTWNDNTNNTIGAEAIVGQVGGALDFDDADDAYILVEATAPTALDNLSPLSVCMWVNIDDVPGAQATLIGKTGGAAYGNGGWALYANRVGGNVLGFYTGRRDWVDTSAAITYDTWQHICVTWDGTDGLGGVRMYNNGVAEHDIGSGLDTGTTDDSAYDIEICADSTSGTLCDAAMDDIRIYNRVLTPAEVSEIHTGIAGGGGGGGSAPTAGLVAYWPFTDSGTAGVDASGNGHDSIWGFGGDTYEISWTAAGHIGGGAYSDGSPDLMTAAGGPDFDLSSYTLTAWIRPETTWSSSGLIVGKTGNGRRNYGMYVENDGTIVCEHGINSNAGTVYTFAPSAVPMSQWSHVACTYDDTTKEISVYVDGQLEDSDTGSSTPDFSTEDLWIGWDEGATNYAYDGILDEVRVYNRALAPAEIVDVFNDEGSGDGPEVAIPDTFLIHPEVNMCTSAAPGPLVKVGESDNTNYYRELEMTTDYMFSTGWNTGVSAFRRNLDGSVTRLATTGGGGTAAGLHFDGTYLYVANMYGNLVAYTFNGTTFTQAGTIDTPGLSIDVAGDDNYLYVADDEAIRAYTFDGTTFTLAGELEIPGDGATHVWTDGAFIYVSALGNGLYILTFNGTDFTQAGRITPSQQVGWSFGDGRYLYVHETWVVGIYEFDGEMVTRVAEFDPIVSTPVYAGFGDGKNLYFSLDDSGTLIAGRFNGTYVEVLHTVTAPSRIFGLRSDGNYLYAGTETTRMQVYSGVGCGGETSMPAGIANPAANLFESKLSVGLDHSCGLKPDGSAWCWGAGLSGQLGIGSSPSIVGTPTRVIDSDGFRQIAAGNLHTCGIRMDGTAWCWGSNGQGRLGDGTIAGSPNIPVAVTGGQRWNKLSGGRRHTCGIDSNADLFCWGDNANGRLGRGSTGGSFGSPQSVSGGIKWRDVSAGNDSTCGIDDRSQLWCWGNNNNVQLASGELSLSSSNVPVLVREAGPWNAVSVGYSSACAIKTDGSLWCWGLGEDCVTGQLAACDEIAPVPLPIAEPGPWANVSVSIQQNPNSACAVKQNGTAWCWGRTTTGHLGNNVETTIARSPQQVADPGPWATIQVGGDHTCGVKIDGSMWCWGTDGNGRLGNGSTLTTNQLIPSRVVRWINRAAWLWDETARNIAAAGTATTNIALGTGVMGYAASGYAHDCTGLGNSHYNDPATGHCYYKVNTPENWGDAERSCKANGAYLAVITSNEEQTKIQAAFGTADHVWLGAKDDETEGEWRFMGGEYDRELFWLGDVNGAPQNGFYSNWMDGEPNNGSNDDCLSMYYGGTWPLWDDSVCNDSKRYICEIGTAGAGGGLSFPAPNTLLRQYSGGSDLLLETAATNANAQVAWGVVGGVGDSRAMGINHTTGDLVLGLTNTAMTDWINAITPQMKVTVDGGVGIGVTGSVFTKLDVNGGLRIGNDAGVCNVMREGTLRYVGGSPAFEYCNGSAWTPL